MSWTLTVFFATLSIASLGIAMFGERIDASRDNRTADARVERLRAWSSLTEEDRRWFGEMDARAGTNTCPPDPDDEWSTGWL